MSNHIHSKLYLARRRVVVPTLAKNMGLSLDYAKTYYDRLMDKLRTDDPQGYESIHKEFEGLLQSAGIKL